MKKHTKLFLTILGFLFLIIVFLYYYSVNIVFVKDFPENSIIFQKIIRPNEHFALKYIHSVAKTPVWEYFKIDKSNSLILTETDFYDHGAGLPYTAFEHEIFVNEDGLFKIKNMSRKISLPLYYRIGKMRENHLIFQDKDIDLSEKLGDDVVTINVKKTNLLRYIILTTIKYVEEEKYE